MVIATVQVADVGAMGVLRSVIRRPKPSATPGLRWADAGLLAPLAMAGPPPVRRAGLFAFWDDDASFDRFLAEDPLAERFAGGFHARLQPRRAYGSWPGLPPDLPTSRAVNEEGPVVVFTLGRLRISQTVRFLRASRPAERTARENEGLLWGSAAVRPPFVATVTLWRDAEATVAYAYGREQPAHSEAIAAQRRKDFHRQSAFIRFAPIRLEGTLRGTNPYTA